MVSSKIHVYKQTRRTPVDTSLLLRTLNHDWDPSHVAEMLTHIDTKALVDLVTAFKKLDSILRDRKRRPVVVVEGGANWRLDPDLRECYQQVNNILDRYLATPRVSLDLFYAPLAARTSRDWQLVWHRMGAGEQPFIEIHLVLIITEVARSGKISSFKNCEQCGRWLIARVRKQRFCKTSCRDKYHTSNEADKVRRRIYRRDNYRKHRDKNIK